MDRFSNSNKIRQPGLDGGRAAWVPGCVFSLRGCAGCVDERTSLCLYLRRTARAGWCNLLSGSSRP